MFRRFQALLACCLAFAAGATPVSREFVTNEIRKVEGHVQDVRRDAAGIGAKLDGVSNKVDRLDLDLGGASNRIDALAASASSASNRLDALDGSAQSTSNRLDGVDASLLELLELIENAKTKDTRETYIYDDSGLPPTNLLDSAGRLFAVTTPGPRGGAWRISQVVGEVTTTFTAAFAGQEGGLFAWRTNGVFEAVYDQSSGDLAVRLLDGSGAEGTYGCGKGLSPLEDEIEGFEYKSGHQFESLTFVRQGALAKADGPYDQFVRKSAYDRDWSGRVVSVNGQTGAVQLNIPSVAGLASETYVRSQLGDWMFQSNPYDRQLQWTSQSVVGRIHSLELTAQEYAHNVVYDLWSDNLGRVINGSGDVFTTREEPYGRWERSTISQPEQVVEQYNNGTNAVDGSFTWRSGAGNVVRYDPETGAVSLNGSDVGNVATNLNPNYGQDLGSVTNETDRNIFKFVVKGWVKNLPRETTVVFDNQLAQKAVTGLRVDNAVDQWGSPYYSRGLVTLPPYKSWLLFTDMYGGWSSGYSENSIVGRIHYLESGGANREYLNRRAMSEFQDSVTATNQSIVANIANIKKDYVTHAASTNIAGKVATNSVDKALIKSRGFYDSDEVDTLIRNSVEQKRVQLLYDDPDDPSQVVDSQGRLFKFGIEDLGGSFEVTASVGGTETFGKYWYDGFDGGSGTYRWTNSYGRVIWYNPAAGSMGDPNSTYEGSDDKKNLNPENGDAIPGIATEFTTAAFTRQLSPDPAPYSRPYDRFAKKSETDQQVHDAANLITNSWPEIYLAADDAAPRRFSPAFQVAGDVAAGLEEHTFAQLTDQNTVGAPSKTELNRTIDVRFTAKLPLPAANKKYLFVKSSNESTFPSAGLIYTNGYQSVLMPYPAEQVFRITASGLIPNAQTPIDVRLLVEKNSGFATLTLSNTVNGASQSFKSSVESRPNAVDDSFRLCMSDPSASSGQFSVDVDSLQVTYGDENPVKFIGVYASSYRRIQAIYAERALGAEHGVHLAPATTNRYGVVKPDGVSIRIENGFLTADSGGMQEDQVKAMMGQRDLDATWPSYQTNSLVGGVKGLQARLPQIEQSLTNLTEQYRLLYESVTNSAAVIESALGGN